MRGHVNRETADCLSISFRMLSNSCVEGGVDGVVHALGTLIRERENVRRSFDRSPTGFERGESASLADAIATSDRRLEEA